MRAQRGCCGHARRRSSTTRPLADTLAATRRRLSSAGWPPSSLHSPRGGVIGFDWLLGLSPSRRFKCSPTVNVDRLKPYHSRAVRRKPNRDPLRGAAPQPQDPPRPALPLGVLAGPPLRRRLVGAGRNPRPRPGAGRRAPQAILGRRRRAASPLPLGPPLGPWLRPPRPSPRPAGCWWRRAHRCWALPCSTGQGWPRRRVARVASRSKTPSRAESRVALNKTESLNIGSSYYLAV